MDSVAGKKRLGPGDDYINGLLGDDPLLRILQRVKKQRDIIACTLVCKRWLQLLSSTCHSLTILRPTVIPAVLVRYPSLTGLDCSLCHQVGDLEVQALSMAYGPHLDQLSLSNNKRISHLGMRCIGEHCARLQHLSLEFCAIGDEALEAVAKCTTLKVLKMANCRAITDIGLSHLAGRLTGLVELSLRWGQGISDAGITLVAAKCTQLEILDLAYTKVTMIGLGAVAALQKLHHLSLAACSLVDDLALICLRNGCKALQTLDLTGCESITDLGVVTLISSVTQLEQLSLNYCRQITDAVLMGLPKLSKLQGLKMDLCSLTAGGLSDASHVSKALQELSFRRCPAVGDVGLSAIITGCSALQRLDLTCCKDITDEALAVIAANCKDLQILKVEGCTQLTAAGLQLVGSACARLKDLDCTDCNINDDGVRAVAQCRQLQILKLGFGLEITDVGAANLGANCQDLTNLDLYRCEGIGDEGLLAIVNGCRSITEINISYTNISDEGMKAFAHSPDLRNGEFRGISRLTSRGLQYLAEECPSLTDIDLKHCSAIGDEGVLAIARHCSNLRQINLSYAPITHVGLMAVARLPCMRNLKLTHCNRVDPLQISNALLKCAGLRKVKILSRLREQIPVQALEELESRGCTIRWVDKPDPVES